ncbi:MAG TPA: hypothetical protein VNK24_01550 [Elusimicrobiota bacterium]|nr:hypothetical protein [Elusimicrobiota bacterium]
MKKQCVAMTSVTTYSAAHRCLKGADAPRAGRRRLCAHHRAQAVRAGSR